MAPEQNSSVPLNSVRTVSCTQMAGLEPKWAQIRPDPFVFANSKPEKKLNCTAAYLVWVPNPFGYGDGQPHVSVRYSDYSTFEG